MAISMQIAPVSMSKAQIELRDLLNGYRFRVCETEEDARRSLAVRRRVYVEEKGIDVEVPDAYDRHSWLLIAEDAETGEAVATMRVTTRAAGPLECEHSFVLPGSLRGPDVVELSRFAILPEHRQGKGRSPSVSIGLFKAVIHFAQRVIGAKRVVLCSKAERVQTYTWLCFRPTGVRAPYTALDGAMHEILVMDLRHGFEPYGNHEMFQFFIEADSPQISLPAAPPPLGLGTVAGSHQLKASA
jgi:N-acyl-L-homoserine lactone synthetase